MRILYTSDGEQAALIELKQLIHNFNENRGWKYRHNETDMRHELASRGWYEGMHEFGRYLVLNLAKLSLEYRDPAMES